MEELYLTKFGEGVGIKTLGWGSTVSQEVRFRTLLEVQGFQPTDSVLDVGCGYGDFSKAIVNYTGIDIRSRAIDEARKRYPDKRFECGPIDSITTRFDWVMASGIFAFDSPDWKTETIRIVKLMFDISTKGIAFNLLSVLTPNRKDSDMKYATLPEILEWIPTLSTKFTVRHDYLQNDMTIYMYK